MRILFSGPPDFGHTLPLLPLAQAARQAGHDVAILTHTSMSQVVSPLRVLTVEPSFDALRAETVRRLMNPALQVCWSDQDVFGQYAPMDYSKVHRAVAEGWTSSALPSLVEFVEIPALSPGFDASWAESGHLRAAVEHVRDWIVSPDVPGARFEILELAGRSPLLMVDVPATSGAVAQGTVILYGHLDKQPSVGE
jgi:hypothetical protein